jgi:hypothetical protein
MQQQQQQQQPSTALGPYLTKPHTKLRHACLRGAWGVEVVTLMLAWKVALPQYVVTLRGNHESAFATQMYGFATELTAKYGASAAKPLYRRFLKARAACASRVAPLRAPALTRVRRATAVLQLAAGSARRPHARLPRRPVPQAAAHARRRAAHDRRRGSRGGRGG